MCGLWSAFSHTGCSASWMCGSAECTHIEQLLPSGCSCEAAALTNQSHDTAVQTHPCLATLLSIRLFRGLVRSLGHGGHRSSLQQAVLWPLLICNPTGQHAQHAYLSVHMCATCPSCTPNTVPEHLTIRIHSRMKPPVEGCDRGFLCSEFKY